MYRKEDNTARRACPAEKRNDPRFGARAPRGENQSMKTTVSPEIENNLAALRHKRGFSVAWLAKTVGVSRPTLYAIEAGSYVPNKAVALRLAHTLE